MQVSILKRNFNYNGVSLADPDPKLTPEQVKNHYAVNYPEMTSAAIEGPTEKNGKLEYAIRRAVETKG